ncbi:hypothetical protein MTO96_041751 [Rhipicephalus appendiculatus]
MDVGLRFATFVAAATAMLATAPTTAEYSSRDRPRIVLDNGNMVFQVPSAKNISFRTSSGRGGIFLNGRDVAEVLAKFSNIRSEAIRQRMAGINYYEKETSVVTGDKYNPSALIADTMSW